MEFVVSVQITIKLFQPCGSLCTRYERRSTFFWSLLEFPSEEDMLTLVRKERGYKLLFPFFPSTPKQSGDFLLNNCNCKFTKGIEGNWYGGDGDSLKNLKIVFGLCCKGQLLMEGSFNKLAVFRSFCKLRMRSSSEIAEKPRYTYCLL